jgi:hypothetical protein
MEQSLANKYFVKRDGDASYHDVATLFDGVNVLSLDGFGKRGAAVNVYRKQWVNSSREDYYIPGGKIVRENPKIKMTFIVGRKYRLSDWSIMSMGTADCSTNIGGVFMSGAVADLEKGQKIVVSQDITGNQNVNFYIYNPERALISSGNVYVAEMDMRVYIGIVADTGGEVDWTIYEETTDFDESSTYDAFLSYVTDAAVWLKSAYYKKEVHCIAAESFEPSTIRLQRGELSYIIGSVTFSAIDEPKSAAIPRPEPVAIISFFTETDQHGNIVVTIVSSDGGDIYYSFGNDIPDINNIYDAETNPDGTTFAYATPLVITEPTIINAVAYRDGEQTSGIEQKEIGAPAVPLIDINGVRILDMTGKPIYCILPS